MRPLFLFSLAFALVVSVSILSAQAPVNEIDELEKWFDEGRSSAPYVSVRSELSLLFARAVKSGVPGELLLYLIYEGAAKRVSGPKMVEAVDLELERLEAGFLMLESLTRKPASSAELIYALRTISIAVQMEIDVGVLAELVMLAESSGRAIAAIETLTDIVGYTAVGGDDLLMLGKALIGSSMKSETFASIGSVYLKGKLTGMSVGDITRIVVPVLRSGGGIIQIDRELTRRGRRR